MGQPQSQRRTWEYQLKTKEEKNSSVEEKLLLPTNQDQYSLVLTRERKWAFILLWDGNQYNPTGGQSGISIKNLHAPFPGNPPLKSRSTEILAQNCVPRFFTPAVCTREKCYKEPAH